MTSKRNKNIKERKNNNNKMNIIYVNKKRKEEAGITLVAMAVTIVVLMMIAIPCIVNIKTVSETDKFTKLKNDITVLKESISQVYASDDTSKIGPKYTGDKSFLNIYQGEKNVTKTSKDIVKNPNDNDNYYVINVSKLKRKLGSKEYGIGLVDLNYGDNNYSIDTTLKELNTTDVYIINEKSRTIYYTAGVNYTSSASKKQYVYYRLPEDFTKISQKNINHVNEPVLKKGMTPIKYVKNSGDTKQSIVATSQDDSDWYNYEEKRWANARTEDGSIWVWIPRFAYRINKTEQTTDVVFVSGLTNNYYDENGKEYVAKRCKTKDDIIDTTTGYTLHPAFTNESSIDYRNGGWDSELYGIWVAKFEAAYATKDDDSNTKANVSASKYNVSCGEYYTQNTVWTSAKIATESARNHVDGIYGETKTTIKYPTFQGSSYSVNYININDAYNVCRKITTTGNIYGLGSDADSHLMKNSEWGAVAYFSKSKYGIEKNDIAVNTKNFANNNGTYVYAATGYNNQGKTWDDSSITSGNWASTTGNIYGIYDISGGAAERTSAYIYNTLGDAVRRSYAASATVGGATSTKYATVYPSNETSTTNTDDLRSQANYEADTKIYGDAIKETSTQGTGMTSWYSGHSSYPRGETPFMSRGGTFGDGKAAGFFYFFRHIDNGVAGVYVSNSIDGFRAVLV